MKYLYAYDNSQVTMSGVLASGYLSGLYAYGNSQITMNDGGVSSLYAYDNSQVTISGGGISNLYAYDSGEVMLDGGEINGYFYVAGNTQVTMSGGLVNCLHVDGSSRVTMSGGTVYHHSLRLESNAILALDGSDFAIDENPFSVGEITSLLGSDYSQEPYRWLTGALANGDIINNQFQIGNNAKMVLIPEPATLFLLSLGAVILRRKR